MLSAKCAGRSGRRLLILPLRLQGRVSYIDSREGAGGLEGLLTVCGHAGARSAYWVPMRQLYPVLPFALALLAAHAARAESLSVALDHSARLHVSGAANVVVGDPTVADVTVMDGHTVFVEGRNYGSSAIVITDREGRTVYSGDVTVVRPASGRVGLSRPRAVRLRLRARLHRRPARRHHAAERRGRGLEPLRRPGHAAGHGPPPLHPARPAGLAARTAGARPRWNSP